MDSALSPLIVAVQPTSAAGRTGSTIGSAAAVVSAVASIRLRTRPGRAASHPSMLTKPAASRYG